MNEAVSVRRRMRMLAAAKFRLNSLEQIDDARASFCIRPVVQAAPGG